MLMLKSFFTGIILFTLVKGIALILEISLIKSFGILIFMLLAVLVTYLVTSHLNESV